MMIEFEGAAVEIDDDGTKIYHPRGKIFIRLNLIQMFYDHTIVVYGTKIRVMDTVDQIREKVMYPFKRKEKKSCDQ